MDINLYRKRCLELREQFGDDKITKEMLNDAWQYWRNEDDQFFEAFILKIKSLPFVVKLTPLDVIEYEDPYKEIGARPKQEPLKLKQASNLEESIKRVGASSLMDLVLDSAKRDKWLKSY